jgi:hypothetical protein
MHLTQIAVFLDPFRSGEIPSAADPAGGSAQDTETISFEEPLSERFLEGDWCPGPDSNRYGVSSEGF